MFIPSRKRCYPDPDPEASRDLFLSCVFVLGDDVETAVTSDWPSGLHAASEPTLRLFRRSSNDSLSRTLVHGGRVSRTLR